MSIPGPTPKDPDKRLRSNPPTFPQTTLDREGGELLGPELPEPERYCEQARAWYEVWRRAPQAQQFLATDWQRLAMIVPLVDRYCRDAADERPSVQRAAARLMAEVRATEKALGGTAEDRLRLRWRLRSGEREEEAAEGKQRQEAQPAREASPDPRLALVASEIGRAHV